jgi:hypothetical protein
MRAYAHPHLFVYGSLHRQVQLVASEGYDHASSALLSQLAHPARQAIVMSADRRHALGQRSQHEASAKECYHFWATASDSCAHTRKRQDVNFRTGKGAKDSCVGARASET